MQAGGGGQVQVGLDELAAGDVPLAALDQAADAGEEVGADTLGLLVEPGLAAGEDEIGVFVAAVGHGGGGGQRLVGARLPGPEPHRVDVGVGDHVDAHAAAQPFTAPAISAPMMNRCSTRKTTTAGTMESTLAAARICVEVWL